MEKSFDFGRILKKHEKKHKSKPTQFVSVADGVQKRLENNLKYRKSSRLTIFDSIRNLSRCPSPAPLSEAQQKMEHRKQQLEKWKEEKQRKKKEAASQKKKPFLAGVPHVPLKFIPPPPVPAKPSTSGRITRSQSARSKLITEKPTLSQSFAPVNASFKPPQLKNIPKVPYVSLVALKPLRNKKTNITFDPVLPKIQNPINEVRQTKSRTQIKPVEAKITRSRANETKTMNKTKPLPKNNIIKIQSSSSNETDVKSPIVRTRNSLSAKSPALQSSTETDSSSQSSNASRQPQSSTESSGQSSIEKQLQIVLTRTKKSLPESPVVSKTPRRFTLRKSASQFTPNNPVPKSESSSEERLRAKSDVLMSPEQTVEEAKKISPCVTMSRGKDNARREMKKKMDEGLLDEDTSDVDNIDHFRRQLASEIKRMTEMCDTWDRVLEQTVLPDSVQECVLGAVGQARLLMSQKLQQFASLVERCARPEPGAALVTPADLHGFWDMVFMQVENVDVRFKKLEALRARGWLEEQAPAPAAAKKARAVRAAKKPVAGASRIKDMIAAARKAKKEQLSATTEKTFEAGFFCVKSPVRSPAPHQLNTPLGKPNLLKAVLSNEAKKSASRNSASFAMLRASVLGKNMECEGVAPLPQTPFQAHTNATPGRSILKQSTDKNSSKKSIKVVLFDQTDDVIDEREPIEEKMAELNVDCGLPSMDVEKEEKENSRRKSNRLMRQDAIEDRGSPVMTRSRRKTITTPQDHPQEKAKAPERNRRSARKSKVLEDVETNIIEDITPKRAPRRRRDVSLRELTA